MQAQSDGEECSSGAVMSYVGIGTLIAATYLRMESPFN